VNAVEEEMRKLLEIYEKLLRSFGEQGWWPADSRLEVVVGAVLTQNTNWKNVEKAIENLKEEELLSWERLLKVSEEKLAEVIRPAGFYRLKAKRLKEVLRYLSKVRRPKREDLLKVNGVGEETADSILLYAYDTPTFVVDAYTRRIMERVMGIEGNLKEFFESNLPKDLKLFKEFHALLVELGKRFCKKEPSCDGCPLSDICKFYNERVPLK